MATVRHRTFRDKKYRHSSHATRAAARIAGDGTSGTGSPTDSHQESQPLARDGTCPVCGAQLTSRPPQGARDIVLRATLPQPIAGALLRTRTLSPREMAVFELLGHGYDNRSLARTLQISERTAKRHVTSILAKLGLESRLQAGLTALLTLSLPARDLRWPEGRMDPLTDPQ